MASTILYILRTWLLLLGALLEKELAIQREKDKRDQHRVRN